MKVARHVQSTQKSLLNLPKNTQKCLLNFSNTLRKSIATAFVFYCGAKRSNTLLGSSHAFYNLFLGGCGEKKRAWFN